VSVEELERVLRASAPDYPFPPTPDLAGAARARLPERRARRLPLRVALVAAAALATVAGVLVLSSGARSAVLDLLDRVPGIEIERAPELPEVDVRALPEYGTEVPLSRAQELFGRPLLLPDGLGDPDHIYWTPFPPGDPITAVWGDERKARLVFTQFKIGGPPLFYKTLGVGTTVEPIEVGGAPGLWMQGDEHVVFYLAPGNTDPDSVLHHGSEAVLAGNVLAWHRGDVIYRLEADVSKERALELARSLEAR
jgi:hypothetical protein